MKKTITAIMLIASTNFANAADIAVPSTTIFDWRGAYLGVQAGYARGDSTYVVDIFPDVTISYDPSGWLLGAYAGYNFQPADKWIAGVEADIAFGGVESGRTQVYSPAPIDQYGHSDIKWQGSLRARLGYEFDRVLPYIAGGIAIASYGHSVEGAAFYDEFEDTAAGWTLGTGIDYAMTDNIIARIEYRYSDYGTQHFEQTGPAFSHTVDLAIHDVRLGMAYKF